MRRECTVKVHEGDKFVTIEVLGDLTASAEKVMEEAYKKALDYDTANVLIKFDGKSRINSAGIAIVINFVIESREKNRLVISER